MSSAPSASDESLPRVEGIRTITSDDEIGLEWPRYDWALSSTERLQAAAKPKRSPPSQTHTPLTT